MSFLKNSVYFFNFETVAAQRFAGSFLPRYTQGYQQFAAQYTASFVEISTLNANQFDDFPKTTDFD